MYKNFNRVATIRGRQPFEGDVYSKKYNTCCKGHTAGNIKPSLRHIWVVSSDIALMFCILSFEEITELQRETLCHSRAL